jgi:triosephosphate isomerase (TIM)
VGHSERRHLFGESDADSGVKTRNALDAGLSVVFCCGEKLEEREASKTMEVVLRQLGSLEISPEEWLRIVIAYEPVWAIGTGKVASVEQAQEVHAAIREWLASSISPEVAAAVRVIYGGSVKPGNCSGLIVQPDIDGFLVGGASLKPAFVDIVNCTRTA